MSKNFKNVLYLLFIIVLCVALPFFIPQLTLLFATIPLVYILIVFFTTRFAGVSRLTSFLSSLVALLYYLFIQKILIQIIRPGLVNYVIFILMIGMVIFISEYITLHDKKKAINIVLKSVGWLVLGFTLNIILSIFLIVPLMMLR